MTGPSTPTAVPLCRPRSTRTATNPIRPADLPGRWVNATPTPSSHSPPMTAQSRSPSSSTTTSIEPAQSAREPTSKAYPFPAVTAGLSCGSSISTVTREGRSILDITQATPTVTVGHKRAVLVRDPHCRFPGRTVIAQRCDTHHLRHRVDGGQHRLDNLVHLCRHHHRFLHEARWTTRGTPDGELYFHPPPDREPDHWLTRTGIATA